MLVAEAGAVAAVAPDGTRKRLLEDARDATYSPDGTLVAFVRAGDLWLANADGSGQRVLARTPNVDEWGPAWLPNGQTIVYTASVNGARQIRLIELPLGPSHRIAASGEEEYSPAVSRSGTLAFVSTRGGTPAVYHWHFLGFDRYELRRTGDLRLLVRDRKSGFCIADHYGTALGVPHGPPRFLGNCAQFHPEARAVTEGSSVGYTDRYPAFFHGQALDVTHVPPGRYWLVHRVNSDFHLREEHYGDDAASLLVQISWPAGRNEAPRVTTLRTCSRERC
jgi:hypothetical protein